MKALSLAATLAIGAACASPAFAQTTADATKSAPFSRTYLGVGVAAADDTIVDGYRANPKIFGGIDYTPNLGIEAGYTRFASRGRDVYFGDHLLGFTGKGYGAYIAGKYTVPINERVSAYGKLGLAYSQREVGYRGDLYDIDSYKEVDRGVYAGLGVQVRLTEKVSLLGEYEHTGKRKFTGAKADAWTAGVKYAF